MSSWVVKEWGRMKRSLGRRWNELRLPRGYARLGTRYGGWWIDTRTIGPRPLLIDCGLGEDISFPQAFLKQFPAAHIIGVEPNPRSLAFCEKHRLPGMDIVPRAFWTRADEQLTFYLPRPQDQLPKGADGVSGSLENSHEYVGGGERLDVLTTNLAALLKSTDRDECDVLKLDIEGAEYDVIEALVASNDVRRVKQLLIEFHHGATHHAMADTENAVRKLQQHGLKLVHVEGRNYIFRRQP